MLGSLNPNISSTPGNIIFLAWVITQNIRRRFPSLINLPMQKYCINSKCNISTKTPVNIVMHVLIQGLFPPTYISPALLTKPGGDCHAMIYTQNMTWLFWATYSPHTFLFQVTTRYFPCMATFLWWTKHMWIEHVGDTNQPHTSHNCFIQRKALHPKIIGVSPIPSIDFCTQVFVSMQAPYWVKYFCMDMSTPQSPPLVTHVSTICHACV